MKSGMPPTRLGLFKRKPNNNEDDLVVVSLTNSASSLDSLDSSSSHSNHEEVVDKKRFKRVQTLSERSKIPIAIFISIGLILALLYLCRVLYVFPEACLSYKDSIALSVNEGRIHLHICVKKVLHSLIALDYGRVGWDSVKQGICLAIIICIFLIFFYFPLRAGLWAKKSKHSLHRCFGMLWLIQYSLACVEFIYNYERAKDSYLPLCVALNGTMQAISAYFSFRVLPTLSDAGYYSDRSVLSRSFVFENIFYQLMCVFGWCYYNDFHRRALQSTQFGKIIEGLFVFYPYVFLRPLFPTTRLINAGTSKAGRSRKLDSFYRVGTNAIKIFYLWAKYFLGFFINWVVYLDETDDHFMFVVRSLYLLNVGTVSSAVFLHTLRFKKVLPPYLTFSVYLLQIYTTFTCLPFVFKKCSDNPMLALLAVLGILLNMTRSRLVHAFWCMSIHFLLLNHISA